MGARADGLPNSEKPRACDVEARKILGPRKSSVFSPPCRAALDEYRRRVNNEEAGLYESISSAAICQLCFYTRFEKGLYESVSATNCRQTGKKLSKQSFGIVPKIAEVDDFIYKRDGNDHPIIREVHPEVCLWALNDKKPMKHGKKKNGKKNDAGLKERRCVLSKHYLDTRKIYDEALKKFPRNKVKEDDILDAIAAAVTAYCCPDNPPTLPTLSPEQDAKLKLPMEMVYCDVG